MAFSTVKAKQEVARLKLKPQDYGGSSWTNQMLADALGTEITTSDSSRKRVLAYPGGSQDPVTKKILTAEQTQEKVASYSRDDAIAELKALGKEMYGILYSPFSPYTQKGKDEYKALLEKKTAALFPKASAQGISQGEIESILNDSVQLTHQQTMQSYKDINAGSGGLVGFLEKATPVITNIGFGIASGGLSLGQQIAVNAAASLAQGGNPEDVVRGAVGTLVANQIKPVGGIDPKTGKTITTGIDIVDDFNKTIQQINDPRLQSAIFNAARQGTYATITEQDVAKNVAAGAVAGAVATQLQQTYKDPEIANALGEYVQARIAGKSDLEAAQTAFSVLAQSNAQKAAEARKISQTELAAMPMEQVMPAGYFDEYFEGKDRTGTFSDVLGDTQQLPQDQQQEKSLEPINIYGKRIYDTNILRLIQSSMGGGTQQEMRSLPAVTVEEKREPELTSVGKQAISEQPEKEPEALPEGITDRDVVLLGLLSGGGGTRVGVQPRGEPRPQDLAGMQALSQALQIGDPGEPLFGARRGKRSNIWNVESLKLKDELGG
jgi:hypothetical protein